MTPDTFATVPELVAGWVCIVTLGMVAVAVGVALAMWVQCRGAQRRRR